MNDEQKNTKSAFEVEITSDDVYESLSDAELEYVTAGIYYLKIDGIDGTVTAEGHEAWIDCGSFQFF